MKNYTERRLEEFDEKSVTLFTRNGLAVLLDYPPHDMVLDEGKVRDFLSTSIAQAEKEMYIQGFKDGFEHSTESFNGEYTHPDVPKDFLEKDAKEALDLLFSLNKEINNK